MKKGKEPIKNKFTDIDSPAFESSLLTISDSIKKELEVKGLGYKFINATLLKRNDNFNKENWRPHKFSSNIEGVNNEGYLRRGDLVLASKPTEEVDSQKRKIRRKTQANQQFNKEQAAELKRMARESGLEAKVYEGYEDNE